MSWVDGQSPLTSPRGSPGQRVGSRREGRRGKDRLKAGPVLYTSKAYISSEQNDSFYACAEV